MTAVMALQLPAFPGTTGGLSGDGAALYLKIPEICGLGLSFTMDGFRAVYSCVTAFMWMMAAIFSREYMMRHHNRNRYYLFLLWTLGATLGVFLSADLYTTFLFFEIMSFTSYVWVAFDERRESLRAAETYLAVAVIGGMVMLMGLFLLYDLAGTLRFDELKGAVSGISGASRMRLYGACGLLLFGFGAKAGCFPLHIWLPKAHPVAPAPASALLSGILTKAGVFGIIVGFLRAFKGRFSLGDCDCLSGAFNHGSGGGFGIVFRQFKENFGLLLRVSDRLYPDRNRHERPFGGSRGEKRPGSQRSLSPYGKSLPV